MSEEFDYSRFALKSSEDAKEAMPSDIDVENAQFLSQVIYDFCMKAGEALVNEKESYLSTEDIEIIVQYIAEWTYCKGIELIYSEIPPDYWVKILQIVAGGIFDSGKESLIDGLDSETVCINIENEVLIHFNRALKQLKEERALTNKQIQSVITADHVDSEKNGHTKQKAQKQLQTEQNKKTGNMALFDQNKFYKSIIKSKRYSFTDKLIIAIRSFAFMAFIIIVSAFCVSAIAYIIISKNIFVQVFAIVLFLFVLYLWWIKSLSLEVNQELSELNTTKKKIQELKAPDRLFDSLIIEKVIFRFGADLLHIVDPEEEGTLLNELANLRKRCTEELGYIIPNIRIQDDYSLAPNQYSILIRENTMESSTVYPDRIAVYKSDWEEIGKEIPEDFIADEYPAYNNDVLWLKPEQVDENDNLRTLEPAEFIICHLKTILIKHVDRVFSLQDVEKRLNLFKKTNENLVKDLLEEIHPVAIREVLVHLIKENVSIKDIEYIFEKLLYFTRVQKIKDIETLVERLRSKLCYQICKSNADTNNVLFSVTLSTEWEKTLDESCKSTDSGRKFLLNPIQAQEFIEESAKSIVEAQARINKLPVILCSSEIRLALYNLLVEHIPEITVISYDELVPEVLVEQAGTIGKVEVD